MELNYGFCYRRTRSFKCDGKRLKLKRKRCLRLNDALVTCAHLWLHKAMEVHAHACVYLCFLSCVRCEEALLLYLFASNGWVSLCAHYIDYCYFTLCSKWSRIQKIVCVGVCVCFSDLGLRHDIEVVKIRGESHVSEDGPIVHRLNRLILQRQRGSIHPDLEERNTQNPIIYYMLLLLVEHPCCLSDIRANTKREI